MKQYTSLCNLFLFHHDTQNVPDKIVKHELHNHNRYEILYLKRGIINYNIEGTNYTVKPGSVVIVNYHEFHKIVVQNDLEYERYVIEFDEIFLSQSFVNVDLFSFIRKKPIGKNNHLTADAVNDYDINYFFEKLHKINQTTIENDLIIRCTLIELVLTLKKIYKKTFMSAPAEPENPEDICNKIVQYIHNNIDHSLSLDEIANSLFFSKYYLCRLFKETIGVPIKEYIITKRVLMANNMINSGMTATEACFKTGFKSYPNFYRAFIKILGHAPSSKTNYPKNNDILNL